MHKKGYIDIIYNGFKIIKRKKKSLSHSCHKTLKSKLKSNIKSVVKSNKNNIL